MTGAVMVMMLGMGTVGVRAFGTVSVDADCGGVHGVGGWEREGERE